jgi:hypothetical protein
MKKLVRMMKLGSMIKVEIDDTTEDDLTVQTMTLL